MSGRPRRGEAREGSIRDRMREAAGTRGREVARRILVSRQTRRFAWARWGQVRAQAAADLRSIYRREQVEWDIAGHARIVRSELSGPARSEVMVRTISSAVSVGTERASFLQEPNTSVGFPAHPGYSAAGRVLRVGRDVADLGPGQLVALRGAHASLLVADRADVFIVPPGVTPDAAAFITLGIITLHGLWRGGLEAGERAVVLGRGPIGQLCVQCATALGAGEVVSVAPTDRHSTPALGRFADRLVATAATGSEALGDLQADVTFEASGAPAAIPDAVRATRDGGRVVLLGSTRGVTRSFDFGELADRRITLIGAHISTLPGTPGTGHDYREAAELFLRLLGERAIEVDPLIDARIDPREAGHFYRTLARDREGWVGAVFDWNLLPGSVRAERVRYIAAPDLADVGSSRPKTIGKRAIPMAVVTDLLARPGGAARAPADPAVPGSLGIAVVGAGLRGSYQAELVKRLERTDLALVMDVSPDLAGALGERLEVPWTTDYDMVVGERAVDTVFLCSPHHAHVDQAIAAARAGKNLIVEKPLAHDLDGAKRIVAAAREAEVRLSTWLGFRYEPQIVGARRIIQEGGVGRLFGADLTYLRHKSVHYSGREADGRPGWRGRWETAGGGVLIMSGIHYLDWLLHLTGERVIEVSARYDTFESTDEVEDAIAMWLRFEGGGLATVNMASCAPGFYRQDSALIACRIWGAHGHIALTEPYQFFSSRSVDAARAERWHLIDLPTMRDAATEYLDRFATSVLQDQPPEITGEDGLRLQAVMEAAYRSGRESGRPVEVDWGDA